MNHPHSLREQIVVDLIAVPDSDLEAVYALVSQLRNGHEPHALQETRGSVVPIAVTGEEPYTGDAAEPTDVFAYLALLDHDKIVEEAMAQAKRAGHRFSENGEEVPNGRNLMDLLKARQIKGLPNDYSITYERELYGRPIDE